MSSEKNNGSGGFDETQKFDSQDELLDLSLDEFENFQDIENEFWRPYQESQRRAEQETSGGDAAGQMRIQSEEPEEATRSWSAKDTDFYYAGLDMEAADDLSPRQQKKAAKAAEKEAKAAQKAAKKAGKKRHKIPGALKALIYLAVVIGGSVILATFGWRWANDVLSLDKEPVSMVVELSSDRTLDEVTDLLKENNFIEYPWLFKLYCKVTNSESKFSFGSFEINTDMDYHALVKALSSSSSTMQTTTVTIPEGYTIDQIFQLLVDNGVCETVEELQEVAANHDYAFDFLQDVGLGDYRRLEGYLFPDTYNFYLGQDPLYVINKMLVNFDNQITEEMRQTATDMGYSLHEIVIVASLIEKESNGTDQRNIASVIYNRLNSDVTNGLLQFDSTIQYILELIGQDRKDKLTAADLAYDSPFNTYLYPGLPLAPICNPGLASFQAALNPADTDYYYFLQDDYGNSYFYHDYDEFITGKSTYLADDYVAPEDDTNYEDVDG